MIKRLCLLIVGTLAVWAVLAVAARSLVGDPAIVQSIAAVLLCLVPAVGTLIWAASSLSRSAEHQLIAIFGGTGARMFLVLAAGWALSALIPALEGPGFWVWLLILYPVTLGLEMTALLCGRDPARQPQPS